MTGLALATPSGPTARPAPADSAGVNSGSDARRRVLIFAQAWACATAWCANVAFAQAPAPSAAAGSWPQGQAAMVRTEELATDDPRGAVAAAERALATVADGETRFWTALGLAVAFANLERPADARRALARARQALLDWPDGGTRAQRWLDYVELSSTWIEGNTRDAQIRLESIRDALGPDADPRLACEITRTDMDLLTDLDSLDEAWMQAERVEACGRQIGKPELVSAALKAMGNITSRGRAATDVDADVFFERALAALGDRPARMSRSVVLWERGGALRGAGRNDAAVEQYRAALTLSRELSDDAGIAAAAISLGMVHLDRGEADAGLRLFGEARPLIEGRDGGFRMMTLAEGTLRAMAMLRRPELSETIAWARHWDMPHAPPAVRANFARALAEALASQNRWADAYAELRRAEELQRQGRALASSVQVLRLQARYTNIQREAELAALRHRSERARLQLAAESAARQALGAAVAALLVIAAGTGIWGWRAWTRRRVLADLALRDELTGQPNRRAIQAYAEAQFEQARRLGVPLAVAMIDLDHFKQVNDARGHAAGDAVLRALSRAAREVLRGQDRLGRWGGEEWLLVMPGTSAAELPTVFERLRSRFAAEAAAGFDGPHGCTFSMGGAEIDAQTPDLAALIQLADRRLYQAKAEGRDRLGTA